MISDSVSARLAEMPNLRLVTGERLFSIAAGLGLDLTGPLTVEAGRRIGAMAGAGIIVAGETRKIDGELVVLTRMIGTASAKVIEESVSGSMMGSLRPLFTKLAATISRIVSERAPEVLSGGASPAAALTNLKEKLAGWDLPEIHVSVIESYGDRKLEKSSSGEELSRLLETSGFRVSEDKTEADVVIFGRASGKVGPRRGDLVTSDITLELRAVDLSKGELLASAGTSHTAVDLFASMAGSKAFREATATLGPEFIGRMTLAWSRSYQSLTP